MALTENTRGALYMAIAMSLFTVNDACMKALAGDVPLFQVIFLRGLVTTTLITLWIAIKARQSLHLPRREIGFVLARATAEAGAAVFFFAALFEMPLGNLSAILQALPLTTTFAAWLLLREQVGWRRFAAIATGFIGVLVIVRPDADGFSIHAGYALLAVVCATMRDIFTRKLAPETPSMTVTLATSVFVTTTAGIGAFFIDWVPLDARSSGLIGAASILILGAYLTIIMAMRHGELGFVAPFRYTSLLVAIILGFLVFDETPDSLSVLGGAIIVGSGLYALNRQNRPVARPVSPPTGQGS